MTGARVFALTVLAMVAFAANSLLCRLALKSTSIDAAMFTSIRLIAGAMTLYAIVRMRSESNQPLGNWRSALALFTYAITFSYAYVSLPAGTGALLLFGSALMITAGVAWGMYSLRGKGAGDPACVTAGNFLRTIPMTLALSAAAWQSISIDTASVVYTLASGALASGIGYAIWYTAMRGLKATSAATAGGVVFLEESITLRLLLSSAAILGGIALVMWRKQSA